VSSSALNVWASTRAERLDRLRAAHVAVSGSGPGRRWQTEELNHSLVLRLASEFQGFARELHDETVSAVVTQVAPRSPQVQLALQIPYTSGRRLDRGNADPGALGSDFGLFGLQLWPELDRRYLKRAPEWNRKLEALNKARNGLAHDDALRLAQVRAAGWPLTLGSVDKWRRALDGLTAAMDDVVAVHVGRLFGARPW
jgi:hypothetical protein